MQTIMDYTIDSTNYFASLMPGDGSGRAEAQGWYWEILYTAPDAGTFLVEHGVAERRLDAYNACCAALIGWQHPADQFYPLTLAMGVRVW